MLAFQRDAQRDARRRRNHAGAVLLRPDRAQPIKKAGLQFDTIPRMWRAAKRRLDP